MTKKNTTRRLQLQQDRGLIRSRWHSTRFVVARVTAPEIEITTDRQPVNLAFVIDRSGSMHGKPIELAMKAVEEAVRRLKSGDRFSVVVFDNEVDTVVPGVFATPQAKSRAIEEIRRVGARGATYLSGGWLRGCELVATELLELGVNRTLLLTDGLANQGITTLEELEHHAAQLRARGVSTSTFGMGDRFDEDLLQHMAQAGGGQFYDIASPEQISDHIESEVGETLEVVARNVSLDVRFPTGVRFESLGAFHGRTGKDRAMIDLGDLVSGQEVVVPLRLSCPTGEEGSSLTAMVSVTDRDGVFEDASQRVAWRFAGDRDNDAQPRDREVDRVIAGIYAARARQEAVRLNRMGDYDAAREALQTTARRIGGYAGDDPELHRVMDELRAESERFHRAMPERMRKQQYAMSRQHMRSRDVEGKARRVSRG